jgi:hypothetical protein
MGEPAPGGGRFFFGDRERAGPDGALDAHLGPHSEEAPRASQANRERFIGRVHEVPVCLFSAGPSARRPSE